MPFIGVGIFSLFLFSGAEGKLLGVDIQTKEGTLNRTGVFVKHNTHTHSN